MDIAYRCDAVTWNKKNLTEDEQDFPTVYVRAADQEKAEELFLRIVHHHHAPATYGVKRIRVAYIEIYDGNEPELNQKQ